MKTMTIGLAFFVLGPAVAMSSAQSFLPLGVTPDGSDEGFVVTEARAISSDGQVVVGSAMTPLSTRGSSRTTAAVWIDGLTQLFEVGSSSEAFGVNVRAGLAVGQAGFASGRPGILFDFRTGTSTQFPEDENGLTVVPYGVSDNSLVVGSIRMGALGTTRAFTYVPGGEITPLFAPENEPAFSEARLISDDGTRIAGNIIQTPDDNSFAGYWADDGSFVLLEGLTPEDLRTTSARGMSPDGGTVVGTSTTESGGQTEAVRWTIGGGVEGLGFLPNASSPFSAANDVSDDGRVVVGFANASGGQSRAFIWTQDEGMRDLREYLVSLGVNVSRMDVLWTAISVSADGRTIAGIGTNAQTRRNEAFIATIPAQLSSVCPADFDRNGSVNLDDFTIFASEFGLGLAECASGCVADLDGDGQVDLDDFTIFAGQFGLLENDCLQ